MSATGRQAIDEWPTDSSGGKRGYIDYGLFVNLHMLVITEAKAVHKVILLQITKLKFTTMAEA